jgi:tRNA 2-selenouridine synthase
MKTININDLLKLIDNDNPKNNPIIIDTRSEKEYQEDHIPYAINLPILNNEERKVVGTLYKDNKDEAYKKGYEYYNQKIPNLINFINTIDNKKKVIIYCWRGGMRSTTMCDFISNLDYDSYQLEGGYKNYREYIRNYYNSFNPNFKFIVLHGLAGSGKTDLIKSLNNSIDLEAFAGHKSSLFGAIGVSPKSQKMFDSSLYIKLNKLKKEKYVFIEGESKKIGNIFIPSKVFEYMSKGINIFVNCPIKRRIEIIVRDYFSFGEDVKIINIINELRQWISNKVADELIMNIENKDYEKVAKVLLIDYYDKRYLYGLKELDMHYNIDNVSSNEGLNQILKIYSTLR